MSDDPGKFYDALNAAGFEYAALSCNGVNLFGDSKSIDAAKRWMHDAGNLAWANSEIVRLRFELKAKENECEIADEQIERMKRASLATGKGGRDG